MTRGLAGNRPVCEGAANWRTAEPLLSWSLSKSVGRLPVASGWKWFLTFKAVTIISFLTQNVTPGSTIYTDGLKSFAGLSEAGFKHVARTQPLRSELRKGPKSAVPLADRAIGNLQQWLIGTYHGVSKAQLQVYLDEFVFRHNRRKTPAAAFQSLLGLGTCRKSTKYEQIRGARDLNPNLLGHAEATG
jgi:transposase-like protein